MFVFESVNNFQLFKLTAIKVRVIDKFLLFYFLGGRGKDSRGREG